MLRSKKVFEIAIDIEKNLAALYGMISTKLDDGAWKSFWKRMESDEENHVSMIEIQLRILVRDKRIDAQIALGEENAAKILETVKGFKENWEKIDLRKAARGDNDDSITPDDIIDGAIFLEEMASTIHTDNLVDIDDKNIKKLFEQLAAQDNEHLSQLRKFSEDFVISRARS